MFNFRRLSVKDENNAMANFETTDVTHSTVVCDSLNQTFSSPLNEFLDLETFKTMPCSNAFQHNFKNCSFFHNVKDMRRPGGFYSSELCKNADNCEMKEACPFSHNYIEQMYQVEKYKTKFCTHYPNNLKQCEYGEHCSYAHSENEILIDLIHNYEFDEDFYMFHYKTIWCPFNINNHDKSLCVYAHNWQDFRRKPHLFDYEENACSLWKYNEIIFDYSQGCPNGLTCKFSHGWKELEYHPLHYKLKLCNLGNNCLKGFACAFFHQKKDRRILSGPLQCKHFKLHPRNRIIANTFKIRSNKMSLQGSFSNGMIPYLGPIKEKQEEQIKKKMSYSKKTKEYYSPNHKNEFPDMRKFSELWQNDPQEFWVKNNKK